MIKKGLKPVYDKNTEILIVGSFPGEESLRREEYYGNSRNYFWRIMQSILNVDFESISYQNKLKKLNENKIGIWDTIESCERKGSLDNAITNPQYTDFSIFENLKKIICNGGLSFRNISYCSIQKGVKVIKVPSTSPANTTMSLKEKTELWKEALLEKPIEHITKDSEPTHDINEFIQSELVKRNLWEVTAVDAACWLDKAKILEDSSSRPGQPLRVLLRKGKINNAIQRNGRSWYIRRND